jgi:hypothetical protein
VLPVVGAAEAGEHAARQARRREIGALSWLVALAWLVVLTPAESPVTDP